MLQSLANNRCGGNCE